MNFLYLSKNFEILKHWKKITKKQSTKELNDLCEKHKLFCYFYNITYNLFSQLPKRKDGADSFSHPCNVVELLKNAKINDEVCFCAGIAHDYIEEMVDLYGKINNIKSDTKGKKQLDNYAIKITKELKQNALNQFSKNKKYKQMINDIIAVLILLTRYKRHHYYSSLSKLFKFKEKNLRRLAIKIKLADRLHNILSLHNYPKHLRIYQCFKNLFIINSTKEYLIEERKNINSKEFAPLIKLFKKCSKATYDALLSIEYDISLNRKVFEASSILQLAFQKFTYEHNGLRAVTKLNVKEKHPMRLFEAIIRKYDFWLHLDKKEYEKAQELERLYCKHFFKKLNLNDEQINEIINYKDAYTLKEIIARLLYDKNYVLKGFTTNRLFL